MCNTYDNHSELEELNINEFYFLDYLGKIWNNLALLRYINSGKARQALLEALKILNE